MALAQTLQFGWFVGYVYHELLSQSAVTAKVYDLY
jgi:beta-lactamase class D